MAFLAPGRAGQMTDSVAAAFEDAYGSPPAVVGRAPGRVNLIGEHTDYNAGTCLPVALPHATYAAVSPRADRLVRVRSAQTDDEWSGRGIGPGEVKGWASYVAGVAWALREDGVDVPGLDVCVDSTVPLGAGLSSSAALECSVAVAIAQLAGLADDDDGRRRLVAACMRAETEVAGAPTGGMDQTVALLAEPGAALLIDFLDHTTNAVPLRLESAGSRSGHRHARLPCSGGRGLRQPPRRLRVRLRSARVPSLRQATLAESRASPTRGSAAARGTSSPRSTASRVRSRPSGATTGRHSATCSGLARLDARRLRDLLPRARHGRRVGPG